MQNKLQKQGIQITCEPFLLPGKFTINVVPRIPQTALRIHTYITIASFYCVYLLSQYKRHKILDRPWLHRTRQNKARKILTNTHIHYNLLINMLNGPQTHPHFKILKDLNTHLPTYHLYLRSIKVAPYPWRMHL